MAQTLVSLLVHLVFSTKDRVPLITPYVEPELFAYIGGILKNNESRLLAAGGTSDHVHLLVSQSKNLALSQLLKEAKKSSSSWIKTRGSSFQKLSLAGWLWRILTGSVGGSGIEAVHCDSERASS